MSRSDTEADMIYANRPKYQVSSIRKFSFSFHFLNFFCFQVGNDVTFITNPYTGDTMIGRVLSSRQVIHGVCESSCDIILGSQIVYRILTPPKSPTILMPEVFSFKTSPKTTYDQLALDDEEYSTYFTSALGPCGFWSRLLFWPGRLMPRHYIVRSNTLHNLRWLLTSFLYLI